jgi:hypothetical protein
LQHVLSVYCLPQYVVYFCTCTRKMKIIQYACISSGYDLALIVLYERQYGTPVLYSPSLVHSKDSLSIHCSFFRFSYCLRQWITREGIVYFQMYRRLYILNCMQCIGMIQLNMQMVAVCKSDILQKQS